jgi:hypothetical protein
MSVGSSELYEPHFSAYPRGGGWRFQHRVAPSAQQRMRSTGDRFADGLADDIDDEARRSDYWRMVYRIRPHLGVHPLCHKALRIVHNHAVLFRH